MRLRIVVASLLGAAILGTASAGRTAAADPIIGTPIPNEPAPIIELTSIRDALAVDLDADGVRELLTLGPALENQEAIAAQATWVSAEGAVQASNQVPLLRSERGDLVPVTTDDAAHLLLVDRVGTTVPLVATGSFSEASGLSLWEVEASGHRLALRQVADTRGSAGSLVAADMDGDGTDEVVVVEGPDQDVSFILAVGILRWDGDRFVRTGASVPSINAIRAAILDAGDSDGRPGEEVLVTGPSTQGPHGVDRISLRPGGPFVERAAPADFARVIPLARGPAIVVSYRGRTPELWDWPPDGEPQGVGISGDGAFVGAVVGPADRTRLFLGLPGETPSSSPTWQPSRPLWIGSVVVAGGNLDGGPSQEIGSSERAAAFREALPDSHDPEIDEVGFLSLEPYLGSFPGGISGIPDAFVFAGQLLWPEDGRDRLVAARDVALLPGLGPAGTVGPDGAWMALLPRDNPFSWSGTGGGQFVIVNPYPSWLEGTLRLVRTASVLEPEVAGARLVPTFRGVLPVPESPADLRLGTESADAQIEGPEGTTVSWSIGDGVDREVIGESGFMRIPISEPGGQGNPAGTTLTARIWAVTPAGHGYSGVWRLHYGVPPAVEIDAADGPLNFGPAITGHTVPGSTMTVDGSPVTLAADGSFEAAVPVAVFPTDVRVVVVDLVGNRAERTVRVVWPIDYRRIPFVPIVVLLTLVAGLILLVRPPGTRPSRRPPEDGATFEEMGG